MPYYFMHILVFLLTLSSGPILFFGLYLGEKKCASCDTKWYNNKYCFFLPPLFSFKKCKGFVCLFLFW